MNRWVKWLEEQNERQAADVTNLLLEVGRLRATADRLAAENTKLKAAERLADYIIEYEPDEVPLNPVGRTLTEEYRKATGR